MHCASSTARMKNEDGSTKRGYICALLVLGVLTYLLCFWLRCGLFDRVCLSFVAVSRTAFLLPAAYLFIAGNQ